MTTGLTETRKNIATGFIVALCPLIVVITVWAHQKPEQVVYRLSPAASKRIDELNQQEALIQAEIKGLLADIPMEARNHCVRDREQYVCAVPAPSPSPKGGK